MGSLLLVPLLCAAVNAGADEQLAQARTHVHNLDYELAREELLELLARDDLSPAQKRDAHMLAGTIARILDRDTESRMHYSAALDEDPTARLDPGQPPKITTFFALVKSQHEAEAKKTVPAPAPSPGPGSPAEAGVSHGLYLGAMGGAGLVALVGVGLSAVGFVPLLQYALAKQALDEKLANKDTSDIGSLYQQQDQAASGFESWGLPLVVGGAAVAVICAAASVGTGALWAAAAWGEGE